MIYIQHSKQTCHRISQNPIIYHCPAAASSSSDTRSRADRMAGGGDGDTRSSRFWLVFSSTSHGHGHGHAFRPSGQFSLTFSLPCSQPVSTHAGPPWVWVAPASLPSPAGVEASATPSCRRAGDSRVAPCAEQ